MAGPNPVYQLANNSANINNGTTYLVTEGAPSLVTFSQVGGAPFALNSFDYARWQGPTIGAATITVTGHRADNTTVMTTLFPVGDFTAGGSGTDFQTALFGADWRNLASVDLLGTGATTGTLNYFAIDNVAVNNSVPEPGTLTLLGLGSAFIGQPSPAYRPLVLWNRGSWQKVRSAAPGGQGERSEHIGHMGATNNAARRDAPPGPYARNLTAPGDSVENHGPEVGTCRPLVRQSGLRGLDATTANSPAPTTPSSLVFTPEVAEGLRGCDNFIEIHATVRASPPLAEGIMARLFDVSNLEVMAAQGVPLPDTPAMAVHRGRLDLLQEHLRRDPAVLGRALAIDDIYPLGARVPRGPRSRAAWRAARWSNAAAHGGRVPGSRRRPVADRARR